MSSVRLHACIALMSLAVGCGGSDDESHSASDTGATAASGFALYEQHCADCHGADAEGTEICLSLVTPHINEQSDSKLFIMISSGTGGRMPAFGEVMSDEEIIRVIDYLRSIQIEDDMHESETMTESSSDVL